LFAFVTDEIMMMRAFETGAFLLLHIILCIEPLCRLNPKFRPLLYNRRHAGVTCFLLGLIHAALVVVTYHAGSDTNPILSVFVSSPINKSISGVPFQPFGFFALVILLLMAATSHDFWLANLTAPVWKALHMLVYVAYALLVLHVTFGVLQGEGSPIYVGTVALGLVTVIALHLIAGFREAHADVGTEMMNVLEGKTLAPRTANSPLNDGYVDACAVAEIPGNRARIVCLSGERVAIFKYEGKISAVSNVCQHQNGPLGEGKIIDGCITCPWHGYQYLPDSGASPPPFTEKVPTFRTLIVGNQVFVHPLPLPPGTRVEPTMIQRETLIHEPGVTKNA